MKQLVFILMLSIFLFVLWMIKPNDRVDLVNVTVNRFDTYLFELFEQNKIEDISCLDMKFGSFNEVFVTQIMQIANEYNVVKKNGKKSNKILLMELASKIVNKMMSNDSFSKWLGIEIIELSEGFCKLQMKIRDDMTNGFKIAHGGITYSLADSALAFASNSNGFQSLTIESSINYFKKVNSGDILSAITNEINKTEKIAKYSIVVSNQNNEKIASFNGKVHRTQKQWFAED